jgi:hypothetical protein
VSGQLHIPAALPRTHWIRGWVGHRTGLDEVEKILPLPGLELRPFDRLTHRQSLYRLRYRGSQRNLEPCRSREILERVHNVWIFNASHVRIESSQSVKHLRKFLQHFPTERVFKREGPATSSTSFILLIFRWPWYYCSVNMVLASRWGYVSGRVSSVVMDGFICSTVLQGIRGALQPTFGESLTLKVATLVINVTYPLHSLPL